MYQIVVLLTAGPGGGSGLCRFEQQVLALLKTDLFPRGDTKGTST